MSDLNKKLLARKKASEASSITLPNNKVATSQRFNAKMNEVMQRTPPTTPSSTPFRSQPSTPITPTWKSPPSSTSDSADLSAMKEELIQVMKEEVRAAKEEIVETVRQELKTVIASLHLQLQQQQQQNGLSEKSLGNMSNGLEKKYDASIEFEKVNSITVTQEDSSVDAWDD